MSILFAGLQNPPAERIAVVNIHGGWAEASRLQDLPTGKEPDLLGMDLKRCLTSAQGLLLAQDFRTWPTSPLWLMSFLIVSDSGFQHLLAVARKSSGRAEPLGTNEKL